MDCLPLDDLCNLQAAYEQRLYEARANQMKGPDDPQEIGIIFDSKFSVMKIDGHLVIVIEDATKEIDEHPMFFGLDNAEPVPDIVPPVILAPDE